MFHGVLTKRVGFLPAALTILMLVSAAGFSQTAATSMPAAPTVTGPIARTTALKSPEHGYPFNATPMDLAKQGYIEEEFFIEGTGSRYNTPQGNPPATGTVIDSGHPYRTRIVVRRPTSKSKFNGTAIIEWT